MGRVMEEAELGGRLSKCVWRGQERETVDGLGSSKWAGGLLAPPEEAESQFEKERGAAHQVPRDRGLAPGVGAQWR